MTQANFTKLSWEILEHHETTTHGALSYSQRRVTQIRRASIPGGWLVQSFDVNEIHNGNEVAAGTGGGITFVPDPMHAWQV